MHQNTVVIVGDAQVLWVTGNVNSLKVFIVLVETVFFNIMVKVPLDERCPVPWVKVAMASATWWIVDPVNYLLAEPSYRPCCCKIKIENHKISVICRSWFIITTWASHCDPRTWWRSALAVVFVIAASAWLPRSQSYLRAATPSLGPMWSLHRMFIIIEVVYEMWIA